MTKKVLILLVLYMFTYTPIMFAQKTRIAVYVFGVLSENYNTLLGDNLVETFTENNQYIAVNRSDALNAVIQRTLEYQRNGHIDYTQIVNATKQYGESQLCAVHVIEIEHMYVFRASLLDVLTNTVIKTASAEAPKSEIKYTKILEIAQKLSNRLLHNAQQSNKPYLSSQRTNSDIELVKKKVEETRQYDISYAAFKTQKYDYFITGSYRSERHPNFDAIQFYYKKYYNVRKTAKLLGYISLAGGLGVALGLEIGNWSLNKNQKIAVWCGSFGVLCVPPITCYIAAPGYRKRAWKEFRHPYDDAIKELNSVRKYQRASLELAPAVGYDWAGLSMVLTLN